jgi:hypothetical protein
MYHWYSWFISRILLIVVRLLNLTWIILNPDHDMDGLFRAFYSGGDRSCFRLDGQSIEIRFLFPNVINSISKLVGTTLSAEWIDTINQEFWLRCRLH